MDSTAPSSRRSSGRRSSTFAEAAESEPIDRVRDHQDIVDERRKALDALGFDVRYRWQIASDSYALINPQEAYLPIIGALKRRGEDDAFGWVSYRDWGGLLKMFIVCSGLRHVVPLDVDGSSDTNDELVLYGGFETG